MTSSASNPSARTHGTRSAARISSITGTCACRSSGAFSRLALYAGYRSWRKVGTRESIATASCPGDRSRTSCSSVRKNTNTDETLRPAGDSRGRFRKAK